MKTQIQLRKQTKFLQLQLFHSWPLNNQMKPQQSPKKIQNLSKVDSHSLVNQLYHKKLLVVLVLWLANLNHHLNQNNKNSLSKNSLVMVRIKTIMNKMMLQHFHSWKRPTIKNNQNHNLVFHSCDEQYFEISYIYLILYFKNVL